MNKTRTCEENPNCIKYAKYSFVLVLALFLIASAVTFFAGEFKISVTEYLLWVAILIFISHILFAYIFNTTMYLAGAIIYNTDKYKTIRTVSVVLSVILFVLLVDDFIENVFYI